MRAMAATERRRWAERNRARRPPPQVAAKVSRRSTPDSPERLFRKRTATPRGPGQSEDPPRVVQASLLGMQRTHGNAFVSRLLESRVSVLRAAPGDESTAARSPYQLDREFDDEGETGKGPVEGAPVPEEGKVATLEAGETSEWGEMDGELVSDTAPHVFVNGGKTGSAMDNTVGGRGGTGDQSVAAITLVAPVYEGADPAAGVAGAQAEAWIRTGTGKATVTRSYKGSLTGANGPTLYMTAAAVARTDAHEVLHVNSSKSIHDAQIVPLEARVGAHTGQPNARRAGATRADAIAALQTFINWNATISAFRTADTAANTPMGTVDTTDLASPTFIRDYGPRAVGGVNYANYFDVPPGPGP